MVGRPGDEDEEGDDMDAIHRLAMVSSDPRAGGEGGEQPVLGRHWLVIATLVLLVLAAGVFLLC